MWYMLPVILVMQLKCNFLDRHPFPLQLVGAIMVGRVVRRGHALAVACSGYRNMCSITVCMDVYMANLPRSLLLK